MILTDRNIVALVDIEQNINISKFGGSYAIEYRENGFSDDYRRGLGIGAGEVGAGIGNPQANGVAAVNVSGADDNGIFNLEVTRCGNIERSAARCAVGFIESG